MSRKKTVSISVQNIRDVMDAKGINQRELAYKLFVSPRYINKIFNEKMTMTVDMVQGVADILQVSQAVITGSIKNSELNIALALEGRTGFKSPLIYEGDREAQASAFCHYIFKLYDQDDLYGTLPASARKAFLNDLESLVWKYAFWGFRLIEDE